MASSAVRGKLQLGNVARAGLRHVGPSQYATRDLRFHIERDDGSIGEWDDPGDSAWFVYTLKQVLSGTFGPPEAVSEHRTLGDAAAWCAQA